MSRRGLRAAGCLAALALALPAARAFAIPPPSTRPSGTRPSSDDEKPPLAAAGTRRLRLHLWGEAGVRDLSGQPFVTLQPGILLEGERLRLVVAPLFEVGLTAPGPGASLLRSQDWDELTDYGRILRSFSWSDRGGHWSVRAGRLSYERLGHGTLVADYVTSLDPDHPHTGAYVSVAGHAWRQQLLAGEVLALQVLAAHTSIAPLGLAGGSTDWHLGFTAAVDGTAPVALTGTLGAGGLPVARTAAVGFVGLDTDVVVWRGKGGAVSPYIDWEMNVAGPLFGAGAIHFGVLADIRLSATSALSVTAEVRGLGPGYIPDYFDAYYSLERWGYPVGGARPKALGDGAPATLGGKLELLLHVGKKLLAGVSGEGAAVGPADLGVHLELKDLYGFTGAIHVAHRGFAGVRALFDDQGWIGVAELRRALGPRGWVALRGGRIFRVSQATAREAPTWDVGLALGGVW